MRAGSAAQFRQSFPVHDKAQRHTVVAPALTGRLRAILEDMPLVADATRAVVFGARQHQSPVAFGADMGVDGLVKTRPAGAAVELGLRAKQRQVAGGTNIGAVTLFIVQRAAPGTLGGFFEQNLVLILIEQLAPLFTGFADTWEITV